MKLAIENFARTANEDKILVLGAMAELGKESLQEHTTIVEEIQKHPWKSVLLVGGDFHKIKHPYHQFNSSAEAGEWLKKSKVQQSYLLVKGSRSMQMEKVLDFLEG
jgi:UDP-N-acetylmuramoyl-tripeptide--D-alanyl-D-alanine ligase